MRIFLIIAAIVLFILAAILAFFHGPTFRDVVGIGFIGAACYAGSALPIP